MADDLLEEMEEGGEDAEIQRESAQPEFEKKPGILKRLKFKITRKRILILAACLAVIGLGTGAGFFIFSGTDEAEESMETARMTQEDVTAALEKPDDIVFEDIVVMEPFERIRLKGSSAMSFISLGISLELTDHRYRKIIYTMQDRLRKIIETQVREATWLELRNPEGKIKLKYELLKRMNSIFPEVTIRNVYFTNFLMQ